MKNALLIVALVAPAAHAEPLGFKLIENVGWPARDFEAPYTLSLRVGPAQLEHVHTRAELEGATHRWLAGEPGFDAIVAQLTDNESDPVAVGLSGAEHTWTNEMWGSSRTVSHGLDYVGEGFQWSAFEVEVRHVWPTDVSMYWRAYAVPEPAALGLLGVAAFVLPTRARRRVSSHPRG